MTSKLPSCMPNLPLRLDRRTMRSVNKLLFSGTVLLLLATGAWCLDKTRKDQVQLAALALPTLARADWQQWDSFLTNVVKKLAQEFRPDQRDRLSEMFLDSRYQLIDALRSGASDPVPQLFTDAWSRLGPILKDAVPGASQQTASQYTSFIRAMDAAGSLSGFAQRFGAFRITPDALRGAARLVGAGDTDPLAYLLDVDTGLRGLFGFTASLPAFRPSPRLEQGRLEEWRRKASAALRLLEVRSAQAAEGEFDRLNEWVPEAPELSDYLLEVRQLLTETSTRVLSKSKMAVEYQQLYRYIVFATGWQESCWRQFIKKGTKLAPLASATGDVGLMQVNRIVWRNLYDIKGLNGDMSYNGNAGAEILHYYLTRYAIRKREDKQPGGTSRGRLIRLITRDPGAWRVTVACAKVQPGKKSTMPFGASFKR